jgi:hydroxyacylglutathione hydrolase
MHEIISLPYGYFDACCYVIRLPSSACLIDPAVAPAKLPASLPPVQWIIATHGHFDHISQADSLRRTTNAPLFIHQAEAEYLAQPQLNLSVTMQRSTSLKPADQLLKDQQMIELTDGYRLLVLHTPGHTPGGVCLVLLCESQPQAMFSGDTLFAGSIGRLDLGGSLNDMVGSLDMLKKYGLQLACDIPVYPGHGPATTLLEEIRYNPYFR